MIKTEKLTIDGREFVKTWSDLNVQVHGGFPEGDYDYAIDPVGLNRYYTETDIPIEQDESTAEEIVEILTGESDD